MARFAGVTLVMAGIFREPATALDTCLCVPGQPTQSDKLEAKRQDAVQRAATADLVKFTNQHGVRAVCLDLEIPERLTANLAQATTDGNPVVVRKHVGFLVEPPIPPGKIWTIQPPRDGLNRAAAAIPLARRVSAVCIADTR